MDIAAMSTAMSQLKLQQNVSVALMKQMMNTTEESMGKMLEMLSDPTALEQLAQPHLGANIDLKL